MTIFLGGATPGTAVAQTNYTLNVTDWSMYVGNIGTSLEGSLSLVNGTLSALTVASNVASTSYQDVQKEFLTVSACSSFLHGPVYCDSFTGQTGSFVNLRVQNLTVTGTLTGGASG